MARTSTRARIGSCLAVVFAAVAWSAASLAAPLDEADSTFLQKASQANAAEVKVSQAAQTRAKDPGVRAFADRMVADHSTLGREIAALAKRTHVDVKTEPDADHMVKIGGLQKMQGGAFDRAYASLMRDDHAAAIALFDKAAAEQGGDAAVKHFAEHALPMLREHAELANQLPH